MYVDEWDQVWLTDSAAKAIEERFQSFPWDRANTNLRQMLGSPGEAWRAEPATDGRVVIGY